MAVWLARGSSKGIKGLNQAIGFVRAFWDLDRKREMKECTRAGLRCAGGKRYSFSTSTQQGKTNEATAEAMRSMNE